MPEALPGIRDDIEQRQEKEAEEQLGKASNLIEVFAAEFYRATAQLSKQRVSKMQ